MSDDDLTTLPRVGPHRAELLRDAGFESAADVLEADRGALTEIKGIGDTVARALQGALPDGGGWSEEGLEEQRTSQFADVRDDLLRHAARPKTKAGVARDAGIARETLYKYLDERPEFAQEFRRQRGIAERRLIERGLEDDPDVDTNFVRFLLERSYDYTKEERHKIDAEVEHSGGIGWRDYIEAAKE